MIENTKNVPLEVGMISCKNILDVPPRNAHENYASRMGKTGMGFDACAGSNRQSTFVN